MRTTASFVALLSLLSSPVWAGKLTLEERLELTRGLTAEYATAKVLFPRSRKALDFDATAAFDRTQWAQIAKENGPAARSGDMVQITKVSIESDRIVLEINGGYNGGRKWYRNVQIAGGPSSNPTPVPVGDNSDPTAPFGTSIAILFHKPLESIPSTEVKKLLAPVLDFDKHTVTQNYVDTLEPEVKQAVKEKRALVGMDREQVLLALGRPNHKSRETKDGIDVEDWVYGEAPGKFTFVTFNGDKVIKVKEAYAGLGTQVADPAPPR